MHMRRQAVQVAHDRLGLRKNVAVNPLQNHLFLREGIAEDAQKGVVDVSVACRIDGDQPARHLKLAHQQRQFHTRCFLIAM